MKQLLKPGRLSSPYLHFVVATLLWAGNFVIGRQAAEFFPPYTLSFFRWLVAYLFLIALIGPQPFKKERN